MYKLYRKNKLDIFGAQMLFFHKKSISMIKSFCMVVFLKITMQTFFYTRNSIHYACNSIMCYWYLIDIVCVLYR